MKCNKILLPSALKKIQPLAGGYFLEPMAVICSLCSALRTTRFSTCLACSHCFPAPNILFDSGRLHGNPLSLILEPMAVICSLCSALRTTRFSTSLACSHCSPLRKNYRFSDPLPTIPAIGNAKTPEGVFAFEPMAGIEPATSSLPWTRSTS